MPVGGAAILKAVRDLREELLAGEPAEAALEFISGERGISVEELRRKFTGTYKLSPENYVSTVTSLAELVETHEIRTAREEAIRRSQMPGAPVFDSPRAWSGRFFVWGGWTLCLIGYRRRPEYGILAVKVGDDRTFSLPSTLIPGLCTLFAKAD